MKSKKSREKSISRTESNHPRVSGAHRPHLFLLPVSGWEGHPNRPPSGTGRELKGILSSSLTLYSHCNSSESQCQGKSLSNEPVCSLHHPSGSGLAGGLRGPLHDSHHNHPIESHQWPHCHRGISLPSLTHSDYSICDFGVTVKSFLKVFFRGSLRGISENRYTHEPWHSHNTK